MGFCKEVILYGSQQSGTSVLRDAKLKSTEVTLTSKGKITKNRRRRSWVLAGKEERPDFCQISCFLERESKRWKGCRYCSYLKELTKLILTYHQEVLEEG